MKFNEFVNTYLGKSVDYDGVAGVQCVDLIKVYLDKVFGIKAGAWGNAYHYWTDFNKHPELVKNFTQIDKMQPTFNPRKGDIVVFTPNVGNGCGHVSIATGESDSLVFYSYDQNWGGKPMKKVQHAYSYVYGVLRPKDQNKIEEPTYSEPTYSNGSFPTPAVWKNGSTKEVVYEKNNFTVELGSLSPKETAQCYSKNGNGYLVVYTLSGTKYHKAGFVKYAGGVSYAPPQSKTYRNGSTPETVYADTGKKTKVGSLDKYEMCYCLGKIDGMYLVAYKLTNTSTYKCGFVEYHGGC